ncbi:MAG: hypothetical protein KKB81_05115 [Candidatus Margulisbacteria bacterium]|nr:hypothetical protein [Candidatus Margulisiibacteriota bacterium]MBU1021361.1 hypothetical protein [Candidatus Margulisiibacteriota bacterium]MBU1729150.1 hypothetical protein [Candidatus Margulisiibacteriota bacterium]MBU1954823.1 hypothetical protein [Candidatus Margulisiibacteriota bacterium]
MNKVVIEISKETMDHINESLLDILESLKKMNEVNQKYFKKWNIQKKLTKAQP